MKFKLDENLGRRCVDLFRAAGHDAITVAEQHLAGAPDTTVIEACREERRCLVTLDVDFGNPLRFTPSACAGIIVLRMPPKPAHEELLLAASTAIAGVAHERIDGRLWIVQRRRIRVYQENLPELDD
jgi:predicted nuclease of predicted toxin-antitoxin system